MAVDNLYHDLPVDRKPPSTTDTEIATTEPKMMQKTNKVANNPAKHETVANTVQTPENPRENIFNLVPLNGEKFCDDEKLFKNVVPLNGEEFRKYEKFDNFILLNGKEFQKYLKLVNLMKIFSILSR